MKTATQLVQFDRSWDPHGANSTPIYQTATFEQESALEFGRYDYSRSGNPTRDVLEAQLAKLDRGVRALAYASGIAAVAAVARLCSPGSRILAGDDLYGGTHRLLSKILEPSGIGFDSVDTTDLDAVGAAITDKTKLVYIETPTNPLQRVTDVRALAALAHAKGALLAVDGTMMTPLLQRPLELGADVVLHSATKHLGGHADVTAGVVTVKDEELAKRVAFSQNAEGTALGPFESWLLLRGLKTLSLRLERQQSNARTIARFLESHPAVQRVHYVGLPSHPGFDVHARQAAGPGSVVSFETGDVEVSRRIAEGCELFGISVSFGGVASSISLPCRMSHASVPAAVRKARSLPEDLVRISVGIEDAADLVEDLSRAIGRAAGARVAVGEVRVPGGVADPALA
jgi:cysteine-S-conjugate beta-lyase